jgi:hypothetical protein
MEMLKEAPPLPEARNPKFRDRPMGPTRTHFTVAVPPHSYRAFEPAQMSLQ